MVFTNQKSFIAQTKKLNKYKLVIGLVLGLAAITTLIGIFPLSAWAEASTFHHAIQHVIIFVSGTGFGGALIAGYTNTRRDDHEG